MQPIPLKDNAAHVTRLTAFCGCLCYAGLIGCAEKSRDEPVDSVSWAFSRSLSVTDDTFVNSVHADNNNGASDSIYTGVSGQGGVMRGLVRFVMPSELQGRVIVTNVKLSLTTRALGNTAAGPPLIQSLQAVSEAWVQGNGVGDVSMLNTVGQICGGAVSGVTWNQSDCVGAPGSGETWSTPGGAVATTISGQVATPGVIDIAVVWDSAVAGNALMNTDVQDWIDTPSSNNGWRISSSDEITPSLAQRFYSSESGIANAPTLAVTYDCKAGFDSAGSDCTSGGTGGASGTAGASSSSVTGNTGTGGISGSGGTSGVAGSVNSSGTGGAPNQAGTGGSHPVGGSTASAGNTGGVTGSSTSSPATDTGGGCTCRAVGPASPARLPALAGVAALLGALSIRRSSRRAPVLH